MQSVHMAPTGLVEMTSTELDCVSAGAAPILIPFAKAALKGALAGAALKAIEEGVKELLE
jgi:hypothetical protein